VLVPNVYVALTSLQALVTLDSLERAKSEDFVQSLHNVLLLQEEVIDKCFLVKCHRVPVIFDAMGHDNTTVRLAALELCMRLLVRAQGATENHIRYNQLHMLQVYVPLDWVFLLNISKRAGWAGGCASCQPQDAHTRRSTQSCCNSQNFDKFERSRCDISRTCLWLQSLVSSCNPSFLFVQ
jgi:hypothetical protein